MSTYAPSGRFAGHALVTLPLLGIPAGAALATLYAYVTLYLPIVGTVSFILTGGLGLLVGMTLVWLLKVGKVRSRAVGLGLSTVVALATLYVSWAVWCAAALSRDGVDASALALVLQPTVLWEVIGAVNEHGAWSLKGLTPTGGALWALWACEALIMVGIPLFMAAAQVDTPFCEACGAWCEEHKAARLTDVPAEGEAAAKALAERDDAKAVEALGAPHEGTPYLRWDVHACGCGETTTLSATHVKPTVDDKGKPGEDTTVWLSYWLLQRAQASAFRRVTAPVSADLVVQQG
jgi:hypothetical protein